MKEVHFIINQKSITETESSRASNHNSKNSILSGNNNKNGNYKMSVLLEVDLKRFRDGSEGITKMCYQQSTATWVSADGLGQWSMDMML